jgi:hypothetical protein
MQVSLRSQYRRSNFRPMKIKPNSSCHSIYPTSNPNSSFYPHHLPILSPPPTSRALVPVAATQQQQALSVGPHCSSAGTGKSRARPRSLTSLRSCRPVSVCWLQPEPQAPRMLLIPCATARTYDLVVANSRQRRQSRWKIGKVEDRCGFAN